MESVVLNRARHADDDGDSHKSGTSTPIFRKQPVSDEKPTSEDGNGTGVRNGTVLPKIVWTELVEETRSKLMSQFEEHLSKALNDLLDKATYRELSLQNIKCQSDYMVDKRVSISQDNEKKLPSKLFRQRESILTELMELSHIRTVYHMFVAILVLFSVNVICHDLLGDHTQTSTFHLDFFEFAFGGFREVVLFWLKMFAITLFVPFLGFMFWCTRRFDLKQPIILDWIMLVIYSLYQIAFMVIPVHFVVSHNLPPASTCIVVMEQVRMFMKSHAFVRSSLDKVICRKPKTDGASENGTTSSTYNQQASIWSPNFSNYLYFLFAPTLVYRESYPRTSEVRWGYVVSNFTQVCGCVLLSYYVIVRFCFSEFVHFGRTSDYTFRQFLLTSTATSLPGGLVMLLTFFAALHSWLNAFAEMLRFGDRLFYKDWWNSTNFSGWYRTWNVVVHDWLYTYLYRDIQLFSNSRRSRTIALAVVFGVSAAVHEYVLSLTFRFFYPILFLFFTVAGYPFMYLKGSGRGWNVFIWVCLFTGWGQMMCLYSMEWYARKNCQPVLGNWVDIAIPHSWFCRPIIAQKA